jgi:Fe-S-cluster containining protein
MHLTQQDINRIENHTSSSFYTQNEDGWIHLLNRNGQCIFHDGTKCTIYTIRPVGCSLYPIVYNIDDKKPILDIACPYKNSFPFTQEKIKQLNILVKTLFKEKNQRLKQINPYRYRHDKK